ncbi:MAG: hypothetical protein G01um10143_318 [Parcubacteria group bacterium Gr01-1014_3]|nr:MAG: hypothetical protein G01um10143_318 [Parcubacteria group bacterium Gr01-1014_3]
MDKYQEQATKTEAEVFSEKSDKPNLAFVDGQNMHFGTTKCYKCAARLKISIKEIKLADCNCGNAWEVNLAKLRVYLKENYNVSEAYYLLGNLKDNNADMYNEIQKAGFILVFKEHHNKSKSKKKGNVDADLVFEVMKNLIDNQNFNQVVLISGDGDYKKLVSYLITKKRFKKILFPNKQFASSLYNELGGEAFDCLENLKTYIA